MITKCAFILRGSCFCEEYSMILSQSKKECKIIAELENGTKIEIVEDKDQNATQYYFIEVSKNCTTLFITPRARAC